MNKSFLFLVILLFCSAMAWGEEKREIKVDVTGLTEEMRSNVLASLSLAQKQNQTDLREGIIRRLFAKGEEEIRTALQPFGYYSPDIDKNLTRKENSWQATYSISPGEPVRITELTLTLAGDGRTDPALIKAAGLFPLHAGDVLEHRRYELGKELLTSTALDEGYRDVTFTSHTVSVHPERHSAAVRLVLDTGPRYYFGSTTFAADFLSAAFLQRLLPYKEGDPFSPKGLVELRQSLLGSEYFSKVDVATGNPLPASRKIPVLVRLQQSRPNKYSFGIGYGTDTGARCSVEWTNRLINRYGHQLSVQIQPSERKSSFGGVYTIPIRDPRKDRLALLGKWEQENFDTTDTEQRSISLSFDHIRDDGEYSLYLAYLDDTYDTGLESGHATLLTPGIKITWRFADSRLKTRRGLRLAFDLTGADQNVFSDTTFLQGTVSAKAILALTPGWRLIGRGQLGSTLVDDIYDLPPQLRYYAGGDQSVRGYAYKSIGPRDPLGNIIGGRYLATYSLEAERTITEDWSAALFFDSGDAFNSVPEMAMKYGAGCGVRWNLPFGQVRLDLARGLTGENQGWRIHFNVGADL